MADRQQQFVVVDDAGMLIEIGVGDYVDAIAVLLGPGEERLLPVWPACGPSPS